MEKNESILTSRITFDSFNPSRLIFDPRRSQIVEAHEQTPDCSLPEDQKQSIRNKKQLKKLTLLAGPYNALLASLGFIGTMKAAGTTSFVSLLSPSTTDAW